MRPKCREGQSAAAPLGLGRRAGGRSSHIVREAVQPATRRVEEVEVVAAALRGEEPPPAALLRPAELGVDVSQHLALLLGESRRLRLRRAAAPALRQAACRLLRRGPLGAARRRPAAARWDWDADRVEQVDEHAALDAQIKARVRLEGGVEVHLEQPWLCVAVEHHVEAEDLEALPVGLAPRVCRDVLLHPLHHDGLDADHRLDDEIVHPPPHLARPRLPHLAQQPLLEGCEGPLGAAGLGVVVDEAGRELVERVVGQVCAAALEAGVCVSLAEGAVGLWG
mmetsp:Transcript_38658/g.129294  ORF Transcript_38658/g.129294 Transcript_38658/m.129294 type:complete len:281 (-) Transcript_38658:866-1708(-)